MVRLGAVVLVLAFLALAAEAQPAGRAPTIAFTEGIASPETELVYSELCPE